MAVRQIYLRAIFVLLALSTLSVPHALSYPIG